jgi:GGDEF domain-containing protein
MFLENKSHLPDQSLFEPIDNSKDQLSTEHYQGVHNWCVKNLKEKKEAFIDKTTGFFNQYAWDDYITHFDGKFGDRSTLVLCEIKSLSDTNDNNKHSDGDILNKKTISFFKETFTRSNDIFFHIDDDKYIICIQDIINPEGRKRLEEYINIQFSKENQLQHGTDFLYSIAHYNPSVDVQGISVLRRRKEISYKTTIDRASEDLNQQKDSYKALP